MIQPALSMAFKGQRKKQTSGGVMNCALGSPGAGIGAAPPATR